MVSGIICWSITSSVAAYIVSIEKFPNFKNDWFYHIIPLCKSVNGSKLSKYRIFAVSTEAYYITNNSIFGNMKKNNAGE